jgi:trimeric autotransporter adhesin
VRWPRVFNLYIVDSGACVVWKANQAAVVTVFAGVVNQCGYNQTQLGMKATATYLNSPYGLGFDLLGQLYIADSGNSLIRKVNVTGTITTIAGNGTFAFGGDGGRRRRRL